MTAEMYRRRAGLALSAAITGPTDHEGPSTYSLTAAELVAEARRARALGWLTWEIEARFERPTS